MPQIAIACLPPGLAVDPAAECRRQAVLVDDLAQRLDDVIRALPCESSFQGWWGPARDAMQGAVDLERARLWREIGRLEGVRVQLLYAAEQVSAVGVPAASSP